MFTKPKPTLPPSDFDAGLTQFVNWLRQYHLSAKTVKNYASDVRRFFLWHSEKIGNLPLENLTPTTFAAYLRYLKDNGFPDSTQARKLASLRKFEQFWQSVSPGSLNWQLPANPGTSTKDELAWGKILQRFVLALTKSGCKETTIQNYAQDVRLFLNFWPAAPLVDICTKPKIATYLEKERQNGRSAWTLRQRLQSLHRFTAWAHREEYLPSDPLASHLTQTLQTTAERFIPLAWFKPRVKPGPVASLFADPEPAAQPGGWRGLYAWYSRLALASYLHLAILLVFCVMVGVFGYQQFFSEVTPRYAYPSAATRPNRVLSFQGRLTDSGATPITTPINFIFRLYDAKTSGNELWDSSDSGVCSLDPDQDGVFSVLLGDNVEGCGNEITDDVFSQRSEVWLEVQVSTETLTPRQPIVTVPYALNTETVQGFPVSLAGGINTIPVINALGEVIIGASNPKLIASSGAFLIQGETLTLQTEPGSGGSINLAPDAGGSVNVLSATTTQNSLYLSNANLTTGSLIRGEVGNNNLTNLISLAAGSALDNKLVVDTLGNMTIDGYLRAPGATLSATYASATPLIVNGTGGQILALNNAGQLSLATQGSSGGLVLGGDTNLYRSGTNELTTSDSLVVGANLTASSLGTAGGVVYAQNASGLLGVTAVGSTGECLISDGVNAPYWGSCGTGGSSGSSYWTASNPVLHPINTSLDLGIGGASTASAKFQVFADSGTATSQGQLTFRGALDPKINILNGENFGIRSSVGGDSGLTERLTILNNGNVGIGTMTSDARLAIQSAGTSSDVFNIKASDGSELLSFIEGSGGDAGAYIKDASGAIKIQLHTATNSYFTGGNVGIGDTTPAALLTVGTGDLFQVNSSGNIAQIGGVAHSLANSSGNLVLTANGELYLNDSRTGNIALSVADTALDAGLPQGLVDAINSLYNGGTASGGFWTQASGILRTVNNTVDVLIGGTSTASAKFAFVNVADGIPTASISAGAAGSSYLTAAGNLATTALQNLILGSATTGDIVLQPRGGTGGLVTVSAPTLRFDQAGSITTTTGTLTLAPNSDLQFFNANNTITSGGNLTIAGDLTVNGGTISRTGNLSITTGGAGNLTLNSAGELYLSDSRTGNIPLSVTDANLNNFAAGDRGLVDALNFLFGKAMPGATGTQAGFWSRLAGLLYPTDTWESLALGGSATATAKLHLNADNGTASTAGTLAFTGLSLDPKIDVLNGENFGVRTSVGGNADLAERFTILNGGNVGIGDTTPAALLTVGNGDLFQVNSSGNVAQIGGVAHSLANSSGNLVLTANGELYLNDSRTGNIALSVADTALNANLTQGIVDAINDNYDYATLYDAFWVQNNADGTLQTANNSVDILFGGTSTASAKFAFINTAGGNPTASIGGNLALGTPLGANPATTLDILNGGTFSLRTSLNGDAGLTNRLFVKNTGQVGIGTAAPTKLLHVLDTGGDTGTVQALIEANSYPQLSFKRTGNNVANGEIRWVGTDDVQDWAIRANYNGTEFSINEGNSERFFIDVGGNTGVGGDTTPNSLFNVGSTSQFQVDSSGNIVAIGGVAHSLADSSGNLVITSNGELSFNDTRTGDIRLSVADTALNVGLTQGVVDAINDLYAAQQAGGTNLWAQLLGAIFPINPSFDALIGGTSTASAKFAFINVDANNPNVPTASISSKVAGLSTYLTGDGTLATTNLARLTLGSTTTGDIIFNPYGNNAGRVGIHTTDPLAVFHTTGAYSDHALAIFDQLFSGDILTASVGGVTKLRITNAGDIAFNQASSITTSTGTLTLNPTGNLQFFSGSNFITSAGNLTVAGNITLGGGHTLTNTSSNLTLTSTSQIVTVNDNLYIAGQNIVDSSNNAYISLIPENLFDVFPTKKIIVSGLLDVTGYVNGQRGATFSAFVPSDKLLVLNGDDHGQTADYINVNTYGMTGGNIFKVTANGLTGINVTGSPSAQLDVQINTNATRGLVLRGATGQSANFTEWRDGSGAVLSYVDESGNFRIGSTAPDRGLLAVSGGNGNALATLNQTSIDQNILVASASGVTRASIDRFGDYTMYGPKKQATTASITDVFVYDTSADLDGGRWTDSAEAKATSWYNETIDATGETCVPTSNDRCGAAVFPKKAVLQADASGLQIYDADTQTMWMRFAQGTTTLGVDANNNPSVVRALNGRVYVGTNGSAATGLYIFDFVTDTITRYDTGGRWLSQQRIASRNSANTFSLVSAITKIPSNIVNDLSASIVNGDGKKLPTNSVTNPFVPTLRYTTTNPAVTATATEQWNTYGRDYLAVGTDGGVNGSVSLIQPDLGNMANIGIVKAPIASKNVFLLNDGTLYYTYRDQSSNAYDKLKVLHNAHTKLSTDPTIGILNTASESADIVYANKNVNSDQAFYGVAYIDAHDNNTVLNHGPALPGNPVINDLWVTKGTSSVDSRGNTIYLATNASGVAVINEKLGDEQNGSVQYHDQYSLTQEMPGDIRGYWDFGHYYGTSRSVNPGDTLGYDGNVTFTAAGVRGTGASFDADAAGGFWGYSNGLYPTGAFTLGAWINPTDLTGRRVVIAKNGGTTRKSFSLYLENGAPIFEVSRDGSLVTTASSSAILAANNWYHLVGVMTPHDSLKLYVNGELVANQKAPVSTIYHNYYSYDTPFSVGTDYQEHDNGVGKYTRNGANNIINVGASDALRKFQKGDYIHVRNVTSDVNTTTVVTDVSALYVTTPGTLGGAAGNVLLVTKLNEGNPIKGVTLDATFKIITGPTGDDFEPGDLVSVYNATTGAHYLVGVNAVNTTTETNITVSSAVGTATTDQIYVSRVSRFGPTHSILDHDATRKIISVANGDNYFKVGDYVHALDYVSTITSTPTVVLSTTSTTITVLDAVGNATTDDVHLAKINKYDPIAGTAASSTQITGPNYGDFSVGDLVELTNTTDSEKAQSTVTAVDGTSITVSAGTASQTGAETIYVAKINNSRAGTENFDGVMDDVFFTGSTLTPEYVKHLFETGWGALQYHTANRITGLTDANTYQQLAGAGAAGATVARTTSVFVDEQKKLLYVGANDATTNTGGVSVISLYSDSVVDFYDDTNNTTKKDDTGTQFDATDVVAISAAGNLPKYLAVAGTNDTTTKLWLEKGDASLQEHFNNNYNPHGETLNQTNLRVEDTLYLGKADGQQNYLETSGNLTKFYGNLQIAGDTVFSGQLLADERKLTVNPILSGTAGSNDGNYVQMEMGGDQLPRLVFYDSTLDQIKYLRCLSTDCQSYHFRVLDDGGETNLDVGAYIGTALGPDNLLRIVYQDVTSTAVVFIRCLDDNCAKINKTVAWGEDDSGYWNDIAIRDDGTAVIVTKNNTTADLELIACQDIDCTIKTNHILETGTATYADIALDNLDRPRIVYQLTSTDLAFIACDDRDCLNFSKATLDTVGNSGYYPKIALGYNTQYPYIASYDATTTDILYTQCTTVDCSVYTSTNLDVSANTYGSWLDLILGSADNPIMSYYDTTGANLRVLVCADITCAATTITALDSTGDVGAYSSLGLINYNYPVIAYYGTTNTEVKLATCTLATCASGTTITGVYSNDTLLMARYRTNLDQVIGLDNMSRIIWVNTTDGDLYYLRCLNLECTSFTRRFLDGTGFVVYSAAITLGNDGFPRIVYDDYTNADTKYIRCTDDDCSAPVTTTALTQLSSSAGVTLADVGWGVDIVVGRDGLARMTVDDGSGLIFMRCLNDDCTAHNAFQANSYHAGVMGESNLILDPNDIPALSRTGYAGSAGAYTYYLRYLRCHNLDCTNGVVTEDIVTYTDANSVPIYQPRLGINPYTGLPFLMHTYNNDSTVIINCSSWESCIYTDYVNWDRFNVGGGVYGAEVDQNTGQLLVGSGITNNISLTTCSDYLCNNQLTNSAYSLTQSTIGVSYGGMMNLRYFGSRTEAVFIVNFAEAVYYVVAPGANYNIGSPDRPFANIFADKFLARNIIVDALDLAEEYPTSERDISAGDVVSFDPNRGERVLRSRITNDPNVAGVVSTKPGVLLQDQNVSGTKVPLALSGRVPVKIDPDSPPIKVGDWLTTSGKPGLAKKATDPGYMIGRALQDWSCTAAEPNEEPEASESASPAPKCPLSTIVFVQLGYFNPDIILAPDGEASSSAELATIEASISGSLADGNAEANYIVRDAAGRIVRQVGRFSQTWIGKIVAGMVQTRELVADQAVINDKLRVPAIRTDWISPTASGSGNITIDLSHTLASDSAIPDYHDFGTLLVKGNASVSGTLFSSDLSAYSARLVQLESQQADVLLLHANDASVSGTLRAGRLEGEVASSQINDLEERVSGIISRQRATSVSASESGLLAGNYQIQHLIDLLNGSPLAESTDPWGTIASASSSGGLTLADLAQINQDVQVNGLLAVNNLMVQDALTLGSTFFHQNELSWDPGETFAVQPSGQGQVSFLASTLVISADGGVTINHNLAVTGSVRAGQGLFADSLQPNAKQNIEVQLASATQPDRLGELIIRGRDNQEIAAFSASGSARLRKLIIASENAAADGETATSVITNATAGTATLPNQTTSFVIRNSQVHDGSLLYITPTSSTQNHVLFVQSKTAENPDTPENEGQFVVAIDAPIDQTINFNWWIIN